MPDTAPIGTRNRLAIEESFARLTDPRVERNKKHTLISLIVMAVSAVIAGCDDWVSIAEYVKLKHRWFATFLEVGSEPPSHDTFGRVFSLLDGQSFSTCFIDWINHVADLSGGRIISLDGKTVRRSHNKAVGKDAIHMVSAWCNLNSMVMGQMKVNEKSNEITAIPKLLEMLIIKNCIITIDAMGCQKEITKTITQKESTYCIAVKENQKNLYEGIVDTFKSAEEEGYEEVADYDYVKTLNKNHGRHEVREYVTISDQSIITYLNPHGQWHGLTTIGMVHSKRTVKGQSAQEERRFYVLSGNVTAKDFAQAVRGHWGIENQLHWLLDVTFRDDQTRVRTEYAAQNLTVLKHIAINLIKQLEDSGSVRVKRMRAAVQQEYMERVLGLR